MKNLRLPTLLLGATMLLSATIAHAQDVDYTGLEQVFGEPITTSATGKPQRISDTTSSMDIIDSETIRRSGAMDIPQILQRYAGMDVVRNFKGQSDVGIRGFNQPLSNRLLVLINGRQVYMDSYGTTIWSSLPIQLAEIKQIEIVRGPNTSLFGFNAESGVINIVTFNPLNDNIGDVELRGGTQKHRELSGVKTIKFSDNFAARISGGALRSDDYSRKDMAFRATADDALEEAAYNVDGRYKISDKSNFRFEMGGNNQTVDSIIPFYNSMVLDSLSRHYRSEFTYNADEWGLWTAQVYRNEVDLGVNGEKFASSDAFIQPDLKNRLNVIELSNLFSPTPNHTFRLGAEFRNNSLEGIAVGTGDENFTMNIFSGNGMWDWKISDKLNMTNAIRVDHWDADRSGGIALTESFLGVTADQANRSETEYSFNSGVIYKATPESYYRASVSRGLHIPSLVELSEAYHLPTLEVYGNPRLNAESNVTFELGYGRKLPAQNAEIMANIFHEKINNVIASTVRSPAIFGGSSRNSLDLTFENVGSSSAYGVELIATGKLINNALKWQANYTYIIAQDDPDGLPDHYLDFSATQPKHKVNLALGYTTGPWELDTDIHFVSSLDYRATTASYTQVRKYASLDNYITTNARVGYNFDANTQLSLDGYNLLDDHFERPTFLNDGRDSQGSNNIGKTVLLTFRRKF